MKFLCCLFLIALPIQLRAAELDSKLETTAKKLTEAAAARGLSTTTLSFFPFQADEKLSKKKVNFAVSEILAKDFLKLGKFTVIERVQLEEVMKEQKLGLSGAIDSKTAADIGKLAGAKLLVLGNVLQIGNSYQLTAKLVDAETGEMIASEISEVPVKTFDEDAERYLVLVPDTQAIGLYLAMGYAPVKAKKAPSAINESTWGTFTPGSPVSSLTFPGVGVRYFLSAKWLVDAFFGLGVNFDNGGKSLFKINAGGSLKTSSWDGLDDSSMIRLSINRTSPISEKFRLHTGAGYMSLTARTENESAQTIAVRPMNWETSAKFLGKKGVSYNTPFIRLGLEWRPKTRLGVSLFGTYNILRKDYKGYSEFVGNSGLVNSRAEVLTQHFTFPQFMLETTLALYF